MAVWYNLWPFVYFFPFWFVWTQKNQATLDRAEVNEIFINPFILLPQVLYQTERYHTSTFGYDIPVAEDGHYLLILKFSEVYFNAPNMKVGQSGGRCFKKTRAAICSAVERAKLVNL
jgi:hypothetical protein